MTAEQLLQSHIDVGLDVHPYGNWASRGSNWGGTTGKPSAIMMHHTAAPVPYPTNRLIGIRLKANIQTQPDGRVNLLAYGACNYSSGPGNYGVLRDIRLGIVPAANARDLGLSDNIDGNPYYWNYENDHYGQGQPLPQVQFDSIIESTRIVADHFGLDAATQTISHAEHTKRKTDPYWNGDRRAIVAIRLALEEDSMTPDQEAKLDAVLAAVDAIPEKIFFKEVTSGGYTRSLLQSWFRTEDNVMRLRAVDVATGDDIDTAVDELINVLPNEVLNRLYHRLSPGPQ